MERPRIKIRLTALDYIVEILAFLLVLSSVVLYVTYYIKAPEIVPIHYNIHGEVDGYGSKISLIGVPIINVLMYVGFTILNRYPHIFNFPTVVTEQNALSLYTIATRTIRLMKLFVCLLFAYTIWHEINIIITRQEHKLSGFYWLLIASIMIYPIFPIVKMVKKSKMKE
jgi:uncharacterized membrane protein